MGPYCGFINTLNSRLVACMCRRGTGFLFVNLGFWRWRELSRRFDTRWKIGRNWDQIQNLRDETSPGMALDGSRDSPMTENHHIFLKIDLSVGFFHNIPYFLCFLVKTYTIRSVSVQIFTWRPPNLIISI